MIFHITLTLTTFETWNKVLYSCKSLWSVYGYSSNKITKTRIQISRQNWNGLFSNISHQMMIWLSPIVSKSKSKGYKPQKIALNSQLQPYQILTNDDQMLILCLSYFITTVHIKQLDERFPNYRNCARTPVIDLGVIELDCHIPNYSSWIYNFLLI